MISLFGRTHLRHSWVVFCFLVAMLTTAFATAHAQEMTFRFTVTYQGETTDERQFGFRENALQGLDEFDVPDPPGIPDASFAAYLSMFSPPTTLPNRWRHDIRPAAVLIEDRIELWQMTIESGAIGGTATIEVAPVIQPPVPYSLYIFGNNLYYTPIQAPATITIPIDSHHLVFFWELRLADEVSTESTAWGGIKALYR